MIFNGKCQINKNNTMIPEGITLQKRNMKMILKSKTHHEVMITMRMIRIDSCDIRKSLT